MKKVTFLLVLFLAGYLSFAQECGTYIELIGTGTHGLTEATLTIDDVENVEKIIVEAIHKSKDAPTPISFSSPLETKNDIEAEEVLYDGSGNLWGYKAHFYRAELKPAETVTIKTGSNDIFSFAAYVYRKSSSVVTASGGEIYHVFQNGDDTPPLTIAVPVPISDNARDINIRFGISELNIDERYAIFKFKAGDVTIPDIIVDHWVVGTEENSYTIQEALLENVPGDIGLVEVTMISPVYTKDSEGKTIRTGDSFIAGIVLADVPCDDKEYMGYCTYTQGYYGNEGGMTCAGETTRELLTSLLFEDLVLGDGDNTFTIGAGEVDCVIDILPGGGASKVLNGASTCEDLGTISTNKQGRLKNTLLAQGITLALNLRLSPDLVNFPIDGEVFITRQTEDCNDPESEGIPGTEQEYAFSQDLVDYFMGYATIGDLLDLVNDALAGEDIGSLSLSQVSDAATLVNEAFDECVVVLEQGDPETTQENIEGGEGSGSEEENDEDSGTKGITGVSNDRSGTTVAIYPNPATDRFYIALPSGISTIRSAAIYNMTGMLVKNLVVEYDLNTENLTEVDASDLLPGIYILKIDTKTGSLSERFGIK